MEGRINQVWWIRYGQKYLKCFLASIVFLCVVGVLLVLITYGIKTGKQPGKNKTPPPNLHMPPPNTNQPISRFEGRINHTVSSDGKFDLPIGLPYEVNCSIFVYTEKLPPKADEISLRSLTSQKTLKYKTCDLQPLAVEKNMWWCSSIFQMPAVKKNGTERLACCSSNWDSGECKNGYIFMLYFEAANVIMSTTVPPWIPSTTIVTLVDRQTPTQLLPTKFQPQTQFPPQISDKMTTGYAVVISLAVVGGLAAFCLIALYVRNKSENATSLLRLSCCRNTYRPHGNDNFPTDDLDLDDDEEDVF